MSALRWVRPGRLLGQCISGQIPVARLTRLAPLLPRQDTHIDYRLRFAVDSQGRCIMDVSVSACLHIRCSSCMQPGRYRLNHTALVLVVECEQQASRHMHGEREPVPLSADGRLDLRQLVEDEVLLSLPMSFMHEQGACPQAAPAGAD